MTHQIDVLCAQKFSCLSRCVRARIVVVRVFSGWFSWFLGIQPANKWLCITQNWLFCVVLVVLLRHVQFFRKNRRSFAWKCFVHEQILLDLAHLETPIKSTAAYFRPHTRKSTIQHLLRSHRRISKYQDRIFGVPFDQSTRTFFWANKKLCGIQPEQIFLTVNYSCYIQCILVPLMPEVVSISRWVAWRSCNISWHTASMVSGTTTDFGRPSQNSSWRELRPRLNSPYYR